MIYLCGILTSFLAFFGCGTYDLQHEDIIDKKFTIKGQCEFHLKNVNGSIHVEMQDVEEIVIHAVKKYARLEDKDKYRVVMQTKMASDDCLVVTCESQGDCKHPYEIDYVIILPLGCRFNNIKNMNGEITADHVASKQMINNMNGDIKIIGGSQEVAAETINGSVQVVDATHGLLLSTINGKVDVLMNKKSQGDCKVSTVHGNIHIAVKDTLTGDVNLSAVTGDVSLQGRDKISGELKSSTVIGNIDITK